MPQSGSGVLGSLLGGGDVRVRWSMAGVEEWGRTFRVIWESTEMGGTSMAQALGVVWHGLDARADGTTFGSEGGEIFDGKPDPSGKLSSFPTTFLEWSVIEKEVGFM